MDKNRTAVSRPAPSDLPSDPTQTHKPRARDTVLGPAVSSPTDDTDPATQPPPAIAYDASALLVPPSRHHYRLEHLIAIGGQGEVWEATQLSLDRPVAVKQLRDEQIDTTAGSTAGATRAEHLFRQEALLTASLEHPNIVPVHDYSLTPGGRAQLSMKLIRGTVWHELILREHADFGPVYLQRHLEVLLAVAQAVAFAHSRGIIHRDIKPGQVVVGDYGEVMLIDWGIAMRVAPPDDSADGRWGASIRGFAFNPAGTPSFMAPEQTTDSVDDLGTWTDVYLLGGTLYFLLTGTPPHRGPGSEASFQAAALGIVEPVRERAPRLPIPDDLARLCDHALQPGIGDRVPSAQAFLQGLRDHLSGASRQRASVEVTDRLRASLASTPTPDYETLGQWQADLAKARVDWPDNPALDPLADSVQQLYTREALAKGDIALAVVQAERIADDQRRAALVDEAQALRERRRRLALQRRWALAAVYVLVALHVVGVTWHLLDVRRRNAELQAAVIKADSASDRARLAQGQSEQLVAFLLDDLRTELEPIGKLGVLHEVGDEVLDYFASRAVEERTPELVLRHASALRWKAAILLREGDLEGAANFGARALAMLGTVEAGQASLPDIVIEHTRVLLGLATAARRSGDLAAAQRYTDQARAAHEGLKDIENPPAELRRSFIDVLNDEAGLRSNTGDYAAALPIFLQGRDRALELQRDDGPTTPTQMLVARCHTNVGRTLVFLERLEDSLVEFRLAEAVWRDLIRRDPENGTRRHYLAVLLANKGSVERRLGDLDAAERTLTERLSFMRSLAEQDPLNMDWQRGLSVAHGGVALIQQTRGHLTEALENYRRNLAILETLLAGNPANAEWRVGLARTHLEVATMLRLLGRTDEARDQIERSMQAIDLGAEASRTLREWNEARANALLARGWLDLATDRSSATLADIAAVREALAAPEAAAIPTVTMARLQATTEMMAARLAARSGQPDEAANHMGAARRAIEAGKVPLSGTYENGLLEAQLHLAEAEVARRRGDQAGAASSCAQVRTSLAPYLESATEPRARLALYEAALGLGDAAEVGALEAWFAEQAMRDPEIERLAADHRP